MSSMNVACARERAQPPAVRANANKTRVARVQSAIRGSDDVQMPCAYPATT